MQEFKTFDIDKFRSFPHWGIYRKAQDTLAIKIDGPFRVFTPEGVMECQDGYLALDTLGRPYPVETAVFEHVYVKKASIAGICLFATEKPTETAP